MTRDAEVENAEVENADPAPEDVLYPLASSLFIEDIETLKVFADPLRLRILRTLYENGEGRALSAKQIRTRIREEGNNRLYYHVKLLEDAGFIRKVFERKRRNLIEGFYIPVAKRLHIAPELFLRERNPDDPDSTSPLVDMASAYLGALHADLPLIERSNPAEVLLAHREFTLSDSQATQMRSELQTILDRYEEVRPEPGSRQHRVTTISYPNEGEEIAAPEREQEDGPTGAAGNETGQD